MNATYIFMVALIAGMVLSGMMGLVILHYRSERSRYEAQRKNLPLATTWGDLEERVAAKSLELERKLEEVRVADEKIAERDRWAAEALVLEKRVEEFQLQLAALGTQREEIEEVMREAASAAASYAEAKQALAGLEDDRNGLQTEIDALRTEIERIGDLSSYEEKKRVAQEEVSLAQAGAAAAKAAQKELERDIDALQDQLDRATQLADNMKSEEARLAALGVEKERIEAEIASARSTKDELDALDREAHRYRSEVASLSEAVTGLTARKAALEGEDASAAGGVDEEKVVADLKHMPDALAAPSVLRERQRTEEGALVDVRDYLKDLGLHYSERTVRAFHTSLKINDYSQLTVLAGVSGTGKSLLPRRYSEAMGIHFQQIAVEPRWDSPQDLLGFYNYVEKKYRATDLARILVQLDPFNTSGFGDQIRSDHMALVLLDEMNLARVEYYFSEFLSRLEARPRYEDVQDPAKRNDARIPLDIRALKKTYSLFPSHNILFAGTMNDDESTQALSDKVLDRGNVMQFAAPKKFEKPEPKRGISRPGEALSFAQWRSWIVGPETMGDAQLGQVDAHIGTLAGIMESCGRPFGHRLRDAVLAYVVNYPKSSSLVSSGAALADQIEFRILPKLRGVDVNDHASAFQDLEKLLRELDERDFADRLRELVEQQSSGNGLFVWRGFSR